MRVPALASADPVLGQIVPLSVTGAVPSFGLLLLGSLTQTPSVLSGGCSLYLDLDAPIVVLTAFTTSGGGFASAVPIPSVPTLIGLSLVVQVVLEPLGGGFEVTNGVLLSLGR